MLTRRGWSEFTVAWMNVTLMILPLGVFAWFFGQGALRPGFWPWLLAGVLGNCVAFTLYFRAIRLTDVSIVLPLVSLSPVFMLLTSWLMLGETLGSRSIFGVLLVAAGAYLLGSSRDRSGWKAPVRALARDPGARAALLVSLVWSVTSNIDKRCILASDSATYPAIHVAAASLLYAPIVWHMTRFREIRAAGRAPLLPALLLAASQSLMLLCQMASLDHFPVPVVIAVKRSGLLVGVIAGLWSGEEGGAWRLAAAVTVLGGVVMILASR